jgi:DNA-binding beta-propeller fold protein YncE
MRALAVVIVLVASAFAPRSAPTARIVVGEGLSEPFAVAFDGDRMFIAEHAGNRVSVWDGARLRALPAAFKGPHHLIAAGDGVIYVADTWNNIVRGIDPASGVVTRVAGTGIKGFAGDGGLAIDAQFGSVFAIDIREKTLYIADLDNRRIRAIDTTTGLARTVAGNGETGVPANGALATTQPLVDPRAVAVDAAGNVYICERGGHALRVVDRAGRIRTVAGTGDAGFSGDGGPALKATFRGPKHISLDTDGSVLITDTENHVIRRFIPASGRIERVAGTGEKGAGGIGGPAASLQLNRPHGAVRHRGALYISDSDNHRIVAVE